MKHVLVNTKFWFSLPFNFKNVNVRTEIVHYPHDVTGTARLLAIISALKFNFWASTFAHSAITRSNCVSMSNASKLVPPVIVTLLTELKLSAVVPSVPTTT